MKERPILFNGPMVRAILEGRKTQTRRVCKLQPHEAAGMTWWPDGHGTDTGTGGGAPGCYLKLCPYGRPDDRLWVREAFSGPFDMSEVPLREWPELCADPASELWFWADGNPPTGDYTKPKPSIHMPRWASRINLEITDVRVERLHDISEADALAEGVTFNHAVKQSRAERMARDSYADLWESINGPGSWDANPWVWVIEFNRVKGGAA